MRSEFPLFTGILQLCARLGNAIDRIVALEKVAGSSPVGHPQRRARRDGLIEVVRHHRRRNCSVDSGSPKDILIVVLGSSRPSSGAEGLVVITELLLPASRSR